MFDRLLKALGSHQPYNTKRLRYIGQFSLCQVSAEVKGPCLIYSQQRRSGFPGAFTILEGKEFVHVNPIPGVSGRNSGYPSGGAVSAP